MFVVIEPQASFAPSQQPPSRGGEAFASSNYQPQSQAPTTATTQAPYPSFNNDAGATRSVPRNMGTPHPRANMHRDAEPEPRQAMPQPAQSHHTENRNIDADIARILQPLSPANEAVYGPPGPRPSEPLRNPLPPPPRDLYEMSPYKNLLNLPQTTALLTATFSDQARAPKRSRTGIFGNKKSSGGLFRSLSSRKHDDSVPDVRFVPIFVDGQQQQGRPLQASGSTSSQNIATPMPIPAPAAPTAAEASAMPIFTHQPSSATPGADMYASGSGDARPVVRFNQLNRSKLADFMNHSSHRVMYKNQTYPSALHLYEALKYLDHHPDIAAQIRATRSAYDVYSLSAHYQKFARKDWPQVYLQVVRIVYSCALWKLTMIGIRWRMCC